jgi:anthranilate synthase component 2
LKLLIIDNYDSFTFNLVQLVEQNGVTDYLLIKNDQLHQLSETGFDKVLISPGPGIASEAGDLMDFLQKYYQKKAILGICLGFEALAELFGGKLRQLQQPMHGLRNKGQILRSDPLFSGLPQQFYIGHYHSWIIPENEMPAELEIIMKDENGLPMAFRHQKYDLVGLQFHPESVMTEFGLEIIRNWLSV